MDLGVAEGVSLNSARRFVFGFIPPALVLNVNVTGESPRRLALNPNPNPSSSEEWTEKRTTSRPGTAPVTNALFLVQR